MKSCAILQSNYVPWKGYFDLINSVDEFVIYDIVQYTKNDWRNRNQIKTRAGKQWLTIPITVEHSCLDTIEQATVSNPSWAKKHWSAWQANYARARYFGDYAPVVSALYQQDLGQHLSGINIQFIQAICRILDIPTQINNASAMHPQGGKVERLIDICKQVGAEIYLSGPAARDYLDEGLFRANGIEVRWMDYSDYPEYDQLFPPFDHAVSALDLIFNEGPNAQRYMKSFQKSPLNASTR